MNIQTLLEELFMDRNCSLVSHDAEAFSWLFQFPPDVQIRATCPWRIVAEGGVAHGHEDDGQLFGLEEPVNGAARSIELLRNRHVQNVELAPETGDLNIHFEGQVRLDLFNDSSGYEGWEINSNQYWIVGQGGGQIAVFQSGGGHPISPSREGDAD